MTNEPLALLSPNFRLITRSSIRQTRKSIINNYLGQGSQWFRCGHVLFNFSFDFTVYQPCRIFNCLGWVTERVIFMFRFCKINILAKIYQGRKMIEISMKKDSSWMTLETVNVKSRYFRCWKTVQEIREIPNFCSNLNSTFFFYIDWLSLKFNQLIKKY